MANYVHLRLKPTQAEGKAMTFHPQKGANAQADVVPLGLGPTRLAPLHPTELLDASVILLDPPRKIPVLQPRQGIHPQVVARPMVRVAVSGDHPEYTNRAIARQMNDPPLRRDVHRADRLRSPKIQPHLAVGLEPPQPIPSQRL